MNTTDLTNHIQFGIMQEGEYHVIFTEEKESDLAQAIALFFKSDNQSTHRMQLVDPMVYLQLLVELEDNHWKECERIVSAVNGYMIEPIGGKTVLTYVRSA